MKKYNKKIIVVLSLFVVLFIGIALVLILNKGDDSNKDNPKDTYKPNDVLVDDFTYSFLKLETNKENLVYSPLSIKYAFAMLSEGADGNTKSEIDNVINTKELTKYKDIDNVLSLANSVFVRDTYKEYIKDEYLNNLKDKYDAEVFFDEFKSASRVNKWIEDKTFDIIKNMLSDDQVRDPNLKVMLVNALAIDMKWENNFDGDDTYSYDFVNGEKKSKVAMMHKKINKEKYYEDDDYTAVSLPLKDYDGTKLEFVAIMPNKTDLDTMIKESSFKDNLQKVLDGLHENTDLNTLVNINIPRFEFEYMLNLKNDLVNLGIKEAFTDNADFSKMSSRNLSVGEVLHKANIKFSEKGIKAGAATVIFVKDNALSLEERKIINLVFDKPFVFLIRDTSTGEIWFVGEVYEPLLWENVKDDYGY